MIDWNVPVLRTPGLWGVPIHVMPGAVLVYGALAALMLVSDLSVAHVAILCGVLLVSVLLHEWGHAFAALLRGSKPTHISLVWFGGACHIPKRQVQGMALILVMGPVANVLLAMFCFGAMIAGYLAAMLLGVMPDQPFEFGSFGYFMCLAVIINLAIAAFT